MDYRENMLSDGEKWGAQLFASRIRELEKEYEKAERRDEVKNAIGKLFEQL